MTDEYDKYVQTSIDKLDEAEDALGDMIRFCSYGEPEFSGSKAMKFFFQNLRDLIGNGKSFLYEIQEEIECCEEKNK